MPIKFDCFGCGATTAYSKRREFEGVLFCSKECYVQCKNKKLAPPAIHASEGSGNGFAFSKTP